MASYSQAVLVQAFQVHIKVGNHIVSVLESPGTKGDNMIGAILCSNF